MKRNILAAAAVFFTGILAGCGGDNGSAGAGPAPDSTFKVQGPAAQTFTDTVDGKVSHLYELKNGKIRALITDYGGRLVSLFVPDKSGGETDVLAGFDSVQGYRRAKGSYFGAIIGRYGNRLAKGKFTVGGVAYIIPPNNGVNALHGGPRGFDDHIWDVLRPNDSTLELSLTSPDGDQGFPGMLKVKVTYTLHAFIGMGIDYTATTDKKTVLNLTNHAYFNLNGAGSGTILDHKLQLFASSYTPVDSGLIPTGVLAPVSGTPFDFSAPTAIGSRIGSDDPQIKMGKGYDHNFVIGDGKPSVTLRHAASVWADKSGVVMDVYTTEPGIQFYTGNFMAGAHAMKYGKTDSYRTAFCLETQHFPDSPNKPHWPSTELDPGQMYHTTTEYRFSVQP